MFLRTLCALALLCTFPFLALGGLSGIGIDTSTTPARFALLTIGGVNTADVNTKAVTSAVASSTTVRVGNGARLSTGTAVKEGTSDALWTLEYRGSKGTAHLVRQVTSSYGGGRYDTCIVPQGTAIVSLFEDSFQSASVPSVHALVSTAGSPVSVVRLTIPASAHTCAVEQLTSVTTPAGSRVAPFAVGALRDTAGNADVVFFSVFDGSKGDSRLFGYTITQSSRTSATPVTGVPTEGLTLKGLRVTSVQAVSPTEAAYQALEIPQGQTSGTFTTRRHDFAAAASTTTTTTSTTTTEKLTFTVASDEAIVLGGSALAAASRYYTAKTKTTTSATASTTTTSMTVTVLAVGSTGAAAAAARTDAFPTQVLPVRLFNLEPVAVGDLEVAGSDILLTGPNLITDSLGTVARCKFTVYTSSQPITTFTASVGTTASVAKETYVEAKLPASSRSTRGVVCAPPQEATTLAATSVHTIVEVQFSADGVDYTPAGQVANTRYAVTNSATLSAKLSKTGIQLNNGYPRGGKATPVQGHIYDSAGYRVLYGTAAASEVRVLVTTGTDTLLSGVSGNTAKATNGRFTYPDLTVGTYSSTSTSTTGSSAVLVPTVVGLNAIRRGSIRALTALALRQQQGSDSRETRNVLAASASLRHRTITRGSVVGIDFAPATTAGATTAKVRFHMIKSDGTTFQIGQDTSMSTGTSSLASIFSNSLHTVDPIGRALNVLELTYTSTATATTTTTSSSATLSGFKITGTAIGTGTLSNGAVVGSCEVARTDKQPVRIMHDATDSSLDSVSFLVLTTHEGTSSTSSTSSFVVELVTRTKNVPKCTTQTLLSSVALPAGRIIAAEFLSGRRVAVVTSDSHFGTASSLLHVVRLPTTAQTAGSTSTTAVAASWQIRNRLIPSSVSGIRQSGEHELAITTPTGVQQIDLEAEDVSLGDTLARIAVANGGVRINERHPLALDAASWNAPPDVRYHVSATAHGNAGSRAHDIHFVGLHGSVTSASIPTTANAAKGSYLALLSFPDPVVDSVVSPAVGSTAGGEALTVRVTGFMTTNPNTRCRVSSGSVNLGADSVTITPPKFATTSTTTTATTTTTIPSYGLDTSSTELDCGTIPSRISALGRPMFVQVSNDGVHFGVSKCIPLPNAACPKANAIVGVAPTSTTTQSTAVNVAQPDKPLEQQVGFFFNGASVANCASLLAEVNKVIQAAGLQTIAEGSSTCIASSVPTSAIAQGVVRRRQGGVAHALQQTNTFSGVVITVAFPSIEDANKFKTFQASTEGQLALGAAGAQILNISQGDGTTTAAGDAAPKVNDEGLTGPEIAGIIIACLAFVSISVFCIIYTQRRRRRRETDPEASPRGGIALRSIPAGLGAVGGAAAATNGSRGSYSSGSEYYGDYTDYGDYDYGDYTTDSAYTDYSYSGASASYSGSSYSGSE